MADGWPLLGLYMVEVKGEGVEEQGRLYLIAEECYGLHRKDEQMEYVSILFCGTINPQNNVKKTSALVDILHCFL